MTTAVIIDAIVVVVLLAFSIRGAKQGLVRALAGLVMVIVALVGAGMIAATFSGPAAKLAAPVIQKHITSRVEEAMAAQTDDAPEEEAGEETQAEALLALLGLDEDVRDSLAEQAEERVRDTGASIVSAVVESMVGSIAYGALFILSFLVLLLLLHVLVGAMDLVMKLPLLHGLNSLGGGALGLIEGTLVLFLAVWAARRLGISFETETLAEAHILRIFTTNTPLSLLSFLH
ncbi:CvpA family protein [Dysosmobacter sp.]|uniref:CvpA family protein n=1 Tax=Dysosmobacter sp. TaxID=2591382 RepID=UPI002A9494F9|nr:CvpA family protein [Dysosmobacter sp.]MDY5612578.1 CvpA family protein [Dysosmobacter sp.]